MIRRFGVVVALAVALTSCTPTPSEAGRHEFDFRCEPAGTLTDDAIVFPNQPGASHLHQFFGVTMTADMTRADLLALSPTTTCFGDGNQSSYWWPAAYDANGAVIEPVRMTGYYRAVAKWPNYVLPPDLKMITYEHEWGVNQLGQPFAEVKFGDCLQVADGAVVTDSVDHVSHTAFSSGGVCPSTHPYPTAKINIRIIYPTQPVSLSSGGLETVHADFYNGWDMASLWELIDRCLNQGRDVVGNEDLCRSHNKGPNQ